MRSSTRKSIILSLPLLIGALMALGALTGCSRPERVSASPPTVSFNVTGNDISAANERAESYCRNYDASPRLLSVQNGVATFSCGSTSRAAAPPASTYSAPTYSAPAYPGTSPVSPRPAE